MLAVVFVAALVMLALATQVGVAILQHRFPAQGKAIEVTGATLNVLDIGPKDAAGPPIVLVHGASGGVGTAALQIARAMGLNIFGTAGTEHGLELIKREGANHAFNHTKPGYEEEIMKATSGKGVDIILEMLANVNLQKDLKLLATNGRVIVIGNRGEITINPRDLMLRRGSIRAFTLWALTEQETKEIYAGLNAGLSNGTLRPVVAKEIPLAEAARAHKEILEPGSAGKIVLIP